MPKHLEYLRDNPGRLTEPRFGRAGQGEAYTSIFADVMDDPELSRSPRNVLGWTPRPAGAPPFCATVSRSARSCFAASHAQAVHDKQIQAIEPSPTRP